MRIEHGKMLTCEGCGFQMFVLEDFDTDLDGIQPHTRQSGTNRCVVETEDECIAIRDKELKAEEDARLMRVVMLEHLVTTFAAFPLAQKLCEMYPNEPDADGRYVTLGACCYFDDIIVRLACEQRCDISMITQGSAATYRELLVDCVTTCRAKIAEGEKA